MKAIFSTFLLLLLLSAYSPVKALEEQRSSRSAGKLQADSSVDLSRQLQITEPLVTRQAATAQNYAAHPDSQHLEGVANRHDQLFEIYAADVRLIADLDGDGYHHALNLFFDVDVNIDSATVYAKLYLSREGAPWSQYFTTDLFVIHGDDPDDAYEIETELVDGYVPGYYSVLIEIYSLDHAYMVTSEVLDYHRLGRELAIEDRARDEPYVESYETASTEYYEEEVYYSSGGGGSFAALLLLFLFIQVVIAVRGSPALSPRNDAY